jgi:hypothetical protein
VRLALFGYGRVRAALVQDDQDLAGDFFDKAFNGSRIVWH